MSVFHQMGFHSNNLVDLPQMSAYSGAIFSPINAEQDEMADQISAAVAARGSQFEIVFDPQLYVPATERGKLKKWSYFPKDVDTADLSNAKWWQSLNGRLSTAAKDIGAGTICSPVVIPKVFDDAYYGLAVDVADDLADRLSKGGKRAIQSVLVNLADVTKSNRPFQIGSIVSKTQCDRVYLIFVGTVEPRRELNSSEELLGGMRLVQVLQQAGMSTIVGFCSSDVVLWKTAGADHCASGKFFNLRRFTRQRFEEPSESGGGQLPYWFEEGLMAFLREQDLLLVRKQGLLGETSLQNPFGLEILAALDEAKASGKKKSWLGLSWREFLYWFANVEGRITSGAVAAEQLLKNADENWGKLEKSRILMIERPNDGSWVRTWLNALTEFGNGA